MKIACLKIYYSQRVAFQLPKLDLKKKKHVKMYLPIFLHHHALKELLCLTL